MPDHTNGKFLFLEPTDAPPIADAADLTFVESPPDVPEAFDAIIGCLSDVGYDPVTQLTAYLIADDPTYLPEETEARAIARRIGRDKLLEYLLSFYLEHNTHDRA